MRADPLLALFSGSTGVSLNGELDTVFDYGLFDTVAKLVKILLIVLRAVFLGTLGAVVSWHQYQLNLFE